MRSLQSILVFPLCATLVAAQAPPQTSSSQQPPSVVIRSGTQEVLLDLVVRDKRERMIRDLTENDVEVYEDGVKQNIRSFRLVSGAEVREQEDKAAAASPSAAAPKLNPNRDINLVLIVFRKIGDARQRQVAREAAEDFLKTELRPNTYVGVFSLDYRLNALQAFTNDAAALKKAVDLAATQAYSEFAKMSDAVLSQTELSTQTFGGPSGGGMTVSGGEVAGRPASTAGADVGTAQGNNILRGILNAERRVFAGDEGIRELEAYKIMVQQLGALPGRKTVLLLTSGLQVPPDQLEVARALEGTANRYNVSIYAVDVNGLTTYSAGSANTESIRSSAAVSATQGNSRQAVTFEQAGQDDKLMYGLRAANQQQSMAELTQNTGGFLIANTNDFKKPLRKVMEDVNTHYEIAYAPKADVYDGRFRRIEVKVNREGVRVQSRNGYFALPEVGGRPIEAYEVAALKALETKPAPRDVDFHVNVLRFRPGPAGWQNTITFEVPTKSLATITLENPARKRIHASLFALIKDQAGQVVDKVSKDVPFEVPAERFENFQAGSILVSQPVTLPPGRYLAEIAVVDHEASKAATRRISLVMPPAPPVAVSNIALVRRIDTLKNPADPFDPFQFGSSKVTPSLESEIPKGSDTPLYFVLYPSSTNAEKPKVVIQFLRDGKEIGRQMPEVDESLKDGRGGIPMMLSAKLDPGQYEVRVTLVQGKDAAQQSTTFNIEN